MPDAEPSPIPPQPEGQPGIARVAFLGVCPRCGIGKLFAGVADFAPACTMCGLDFTHFNVGDGPAAFLTLIDGLAIVLLALWMHFTLRAPMWLIGLVLVPVTAALVIWGLRVGKAALLGAEFQRRAGEFQSHDPDVGAADGPHVS